MLIYIFCACLGYCVRSSSSFRNIVLFSGENSEIAIASATNESDNKLSDSIQLEDDDDEEWEYEEFEVLNVEDFYGSEWKVGTLNDNSNKIQETWVRLLQEDDQAIWGDGAKGKWKLDVPNQFLSISKETFGGWGGKKIWACQLDDYYYLEGTVRGWAPWMAATVFAQWQARRLGVDKDEAGTAPWFEREEEEPNIDEVGEKQVQEAIEDNTTEDNESDDSANTAEETYETKE